MLVRGAPAQFFVGWSAGVARRVLWDEDRGELGPPVLAGTRPGDDRDAAGDIGSGVGDPLLRPVDDPLAPIELGRRARPSRVRAGLLLRQAEGPEVLARRTPGEEFLLLFLGAVGGDGGAAKGDVGLHSYPYRGVCA